MGKKSGRAKDNQIKKEHLLDPNGQYGLSDKFRLCLSEVFERFDEGKDGALSRDELQNFAVAANAGNNLQDDEVTQLQQFFETNSKGELTLKGFMQMYHMQTTARSSDTWKDLQRLGYLPNLEPASGPRPPQASTPPAAEKPAAAAEADTVFTAAGNDLVASIESQSASMPAFEAVSPKRESGPWKRAGPRPR